jgi:glyoxylase-like metal-dependent hydrolase (beta-lactamase superfamily II)
MQDPTFRAAVERTGRKKLVIGGITTDLCVVFPAITAVADGYDVYVVGDACASWNRRIDDLAIARVRQAGAIVTNVQSLAAELQTNLAARDEAAARAAPDGLVRVLRHVRRAARAAERRVHAEPREPPTVRARRRRGGWGGKGGRRTLGRSGRPLRVTGRRRDRTLLLSPREAAHPQACRGGFHFENPAGHPSLGAAGLEALPFPGHTEGHVVLYGAAGGGVLLAGDCAMGATRAEGASGMATLVRPPDALTVDDGELRRQWVAFDRPLATVCPFHGEPLVGDAEAVRRALAALRADAPTGTLGVRSAVSPT